MKGLKWIMALMAFMVCAIGYSAGTNKTDAVKAGIREQVEITYLSQVHVRELTGHNDGKEVEAYLASTGLGKGFAWCAAFANWVYVQHDIATPGSPAWSPSWFPKKRVIPNEKAQKGDVMGIYFKSKKRIAHVGLIHKWPPNTSYCITVEGNTNGAGSREGDGVYVKRRLKRQVNKVTNWIDNPPNT